MSRLKKERLNQMIENALSYKQEIIIEKSFPLSEKLKYFTLKLNFYEVTFASVIISCIFISPKIISKNSLDLNELNDYITYEIIEDLKL